MARIDMDTGSEGPKHDPYGFCRITFTRTDGVEVVYHSGLGEWTKATFPRKGHPIPFETFVWREGTAAAAFENLTGLHPRKAQKVYDRLHGPKSKCPHCGSKKLSWSSGYPGESLQLCDSCKHIVYSEVNMAAIE